MPKAKLRMPLVETVQYVGRENLNEVKYFFDKVKDKRKLIQDIESDRLWVLCQYCEWSNPVQMLLQKNDYIVRDMNGNYKIYTESAYNKTYEEVRY